MIADANIYTVTITGLNYANVDMGNFVFDVEFINPCIEEPLIIDSGDSVFGAPALTHNVWQPASSLTWDDTIVTMTNLADPTAECGPVTFEVLMQDGAPLDTIFTATLFGFIGAY